jgi:hypothetical protein
VTTVEIDQDQHVLSGKQFRSLIACEAILEHLSNEVLGSLPLMEPLARREFGNTNYTILIQTAERAREALKQSKAAWPVPSDLKQGVEATQ